MKKLIGLIILVVVIFTSKAGMTMFKKYRHAKRLKIGVSKFKLLNLSSQIKSKIVLTIGNFSPSAFNINQIKVDIYTTNGQLLAQQIAPLSESIVLNPNQNNKLPLAYQINAPILISEIKKLGGVTNVLTSFLTTGKYGLPIQLKGFVSVGLIDISINQTINV